jgi:hypothetical protein
MQFATTLLQWLRRNSGGWHNLVKFRNELDKWLESRILNKLEFWKNSVYFSYTPAIPAFLIWHTGLAYRACWDR